MKKCQLIIAMLMAAIMLAYSLPISAQTIPPEGETGFNASKGEPTLYGYRYYSNAENAVPHVWLSFPPSDLDEQTVICGGTAPSNYPHVQSATYYHGKVYGFWSDCSFFSCDFNDLALQSSSVGNTWGANIYGISYNYSDKTMYALSCSSWAGSSLYTVNLDTGNLTPLPIYLSGSETLLKSLAITPEGDAYVMSSNGIFCSLDLATGEVVTIADTGMYPHEGCNLVYDANSNTMYYYYADYETPGIYIIDMESGAVEVVSTASSIMGLGGIFVVYEPVWEVYDVTFVDGYTGEVIVTQQVEEGLAAIPPVVPIHADVTFVGWDIDFSHISSNVTITALFEAADGWNDIDSYINMDEGTIDFRTDGDYPWYASITAGRTLALSGNSNAGHECISQLKTTVNLNAGDIIKFEWAVDGLDYYTRDYFKFYVNGFEVASIYGKTQWTEYTYDITQDGTYILAWSYVKASYLSAGADCGFLDNVYAGAPPQPERIVMGDSITVPVGASERLIYRVEPYYSNAEIIWSSEDSSIVSVNGGRIIANASGSATITARTAEGLEAHITVNVIPTPAASEAYAYCTSSNVINAGWVSFLTDTGMFASIQGGVPDVFAAEYVNGTVYCFDENGQLFTTSIAANFEGTPLGSTTGSYVYAMAYNYTDSTMYAIVLRENTRTLATIDLETGSINAYGEELSVQGSPFICLAIDLSGNAYGLTGTGMLYSINLETGAAELIGATGYSARYIQTMAFDHNTETLYWARYDDDGGKLLIVDTDSGFACDITPAYTNAELVGLIIPYEHSIPGDIDSDGEVSANDALIALRFAMDLVELDDRQRSAGDINGDGTVDSSDALMILRFALTV